MSTHGARQRGIRCVKVLASGKRKLWGKEGKDRQGRGNRTWGEINGDVQTDKKKVLRCEQMKSTAGPGPKRPDKQEVNHTKAAVRCRRGKGYPFGMLTDLLDTSVARKSKPSTMRGIGI